LHTSLALFLTFFPYSFILFLNTHNIISCRSWCQFTGLVLFNLIYLLIHNIYPMFVFACFINISSTIFANMVIWAWYVVFESCLLVWTPSLLSPIIWFSRWFFCTCLKGSFEWVFVFSDSSSRTSFYSFSWWWSKGLIKHVFMFLSSSSSSKFTSIQSTILCNHLL